MEKDDEVKGSGNSYDFGARMYDSRIGKWMSLDAHMIKYPSVSHYNFVNNNPIIFIDEDGNDLVYFDSEGNEMSELRIVSNTEFKAFVHNGTYDVHATRCLR